MVDVGGLTHLLLKPLLDEGRERGGRTELIKPANSLRHLNTHGSCGGWDSAARWN